MDHIYSLTDELLEAIQNSSILKVYLSAKDRVEASPALCAKIRSFKTIQLDYQAKILADEKPSFTDEKNICSLYTGLLLNDDARLFLESEKTLLQLVSNILNAISESCQIDLAL